MIRNAVIDRRIGLLAALCYAAAAGIYIITGIALTSDDVGAELPRVLPFIAVALLSTSLCAYMSRSSLLDAAYSRRWGDSIGRGFKVTLLSGLMASVLSWVFAIFAGAITGRNAESSAADLFLLSAFLFIRYEAPALLLALPFSIPGSLLFHRLVRDIGESDEENRAMSEM